VKGEVKAAEILHRLKAQCGEEILSHASAYDWHNKFCDDHKEVSNLLHANIQPTAVHDVNIRLVERLILGNRQITVCNIAYNSTISVLSVETIFHEHLLFKKVCAWGFPKILMYNQKLQHVAVAAEHLHRFQLVVNTFLE
jgi:hypothetical protein